MSSSHPAPVVTTMLCEPTVGGSSLTRLGERGRLRAQGSAAATVPTAPGRTRWLLSPRAGAATLACPGAATASFVRTMSAGRSRRGCERPGGRPGGCDGACPRCGSHDRRSGGGASRRGQRSRHSSGLGERRTPPPGELLPGYAFPRRGQWVRRSLPSPPELGERRRARELSYRRACRLMSPAGLRERSRSPGLVDRPRVRTPSCPHARRPSPLPELRVGRGQPWRDHRDAGEHEDRWPASSPGLHDAGGSSLPDLHIARSRALPAGPESSCRTSDRRPRRVPRSGGLKDRRCVLVSCARRASRRRG